MGTEPRQHWLTRLVSHDLSNDLFIAHPPVDRLPQSRRNSRGQCCKGQSRKVSRPAEPAEERGAGL